MQKTTVKSDMPKMALIASLEIMAKQHEGARVASTGAIWGYVIVGLSALFFITSLYVNYVNYALYVCANNATNWNVVGMSLLWQSYYQLQMVDFQ